MEVLSKDNLVKFKEHRLFFKDHQISILFVKYNYCQFLSPDRVSLFQTEAI